QLREERREPTPAEEGQQLSAICEAGAGTSDAAAPTGGEVRHGAVMANIARVEDASRPVRPQVQFSMSVLSDVQIGGVRRALDEFLSFVPNPPPLPGPGKDKEAVIESWCRQHNARDRKELGSAWTKRLEALGAA